VVIKQILCHIKGTVNFGVVYRRGGDQVITGYSDNSHNTERDDGRSTMGHVFYYEKTPITWCLQKQSIVALSSCEAEFMAAASVACQRIWLGGLYGEIMGGDSQTVTLRVINKSTMALMKNLVFYGKSKHIDMRYHFIRECVEEEKVLIEFISGNEQRADILTKPLARIKFTEMRKLLGVEDLPISSR
jgi:hypothetical protein